MRKNTQGIKKVNAATIFYVKKTVFVFVILIALIVATGLWFSPLVGKGKTYAYHDNVATGEIAGICYTADEVRTDFDGDESDMLSALGRICAKVVKTVRTDDCVIVYAYSPRVAAKAQTTAEGDEYNVMAACSERGVSIGIPVLPGSY